MKVKSSCSIILLRLESVVKGIYTNLYKSTLFHLRKFLFPPFALGFYVITLKKKKKLSDAFSYLHYCLTLFFSYGSGLSLKDREVDSSVIPS